MAIIKKEFAGHYLQQSVFRCHMLHSTPDDSGDYVILVLLGLTAAFDTMDNVLVEWLLQLVGIFGSTLDGFRSYLADRTMCVNGE